jgi:hypothetical protein
MDAKTVFAIVALVGSFGGTLAVGSQARAAGDGEFTAQGSACASGYHADRQGNCQPNNPEPNLQPCPAGLLATPMPYGYRCVPIPAGY